MALKVVSMRELKLEVLFEPARTGETVAEVCLRRGISRASYYRYRRRYMQDGLPGLKARSSRPRFSPAQISASLEAEICTLRRRHPRWGARRIHAELARAGITPPAVATIHRALRRNHLVSPQPRRRPKADKRFEREAPNDLWQIDATQVSLADTSKAWIVDCLDDHARFCLSALACQSPTGEAAWENFTRAAAAYGLPRQLLSDNGSTFTGRLLWRRGRLRAAPSRSRGRTDQRPPLPPTDPRQARALPPHFEGVALRRRQGLGSRAPAASARSFPGLLQRAAPPPRNRQSDASRALPRGRRLARCACPRRRSRTSLPAPFARTHGRLERSLPLRGQLDQRRLALRGSAGADRRARRARARLLRRGARALARTRSWPSLPASWQTPTKGGDHQALAPVSQLMSTRCLT